MKLLRKILILLTVMIITSSIAYSQEVRVRKDTATVRQQQTGQQTKEQTGMQEQAAEGNQAQNQGEQADQSGNQSGDNAQAGNQAREGNSSSITSKVQGASAGGVKKIQSARPDWSRASGARPASVERPSGSRIPKGAGKPGGARGPGKR